MKTQKEDKIKVIINPSINWLRNKMNKKEHKSDWEKEFDKEFELRMNGCSECGGADLLENGKDIFDLDSIKSFIKSLLVQQKQELIKEFIEGKRCYKCGKEKESIVMDFCDNCLENN